MQDYYSLFGLPERFELDISLLEQNYRRVQAQVHPDRFASRSEAERRVAMQWAALANEAFRTLRNPISRARYLLNRRGTAIDSEKNTAMTPEFLMQQMEWREAVEDSAGDVARLQSLSENFEHEARSMLEQLKRLLDDTPDNVAAAEVVRKLMFIEKLRSEIVDAVAAQEN